MSQYVADVIPTAFPSPSVIDTNLIKYPVPRSSLAACAALASVTGAVTVAVPDDKDEL